MPLPAAGARAVMSLRRLSSNPTPPLLGQDEHGLAFVESQCELILFFSRHGADLRRGIHARIDELLELTSIFM
jgi:hypothetical protein